jgi:hypothetical protein
MRAPRRVRRSVVERTENERSQREVDEPGAKEEKPAGPHDEGRQDEERQRTDRCGAPSPERAHSLDGDAATLAKKSPAVFVMLDS